MELYEIKRVLSENGNVALAKVNLERQEIAEFFERINARLEEICKDKEGETRIVVATAEYQLDDNDIQEIKKALRKRKKGVAQSRQEYSKIIDDMRRKQERLENGRK